MRVRKFIILGFLILILFPMAVFAPMSGTCSAVALAMIIGLVILVETS